MREGRVFLAGDAAHVWIPFGGYGMNAGIADAIGLGWLLDAVLTGWGGEGMLDAYAAERHPITGQVSELAMNSSMKHLGSRWDVPAEIAEDSAAGAAAREYVRENIYELNLHSYCCAGLNFGYFYEASPIIAYDGEKAPTYDVFNYTPSTAPGCRMPHVTLPDGRSLYDTLGAGYTLFRNDPEVSVGIPGDRHPFHGRTAYSRGHTALSRARAEACLDEARFPRGLAGRRGSARRSQPGANVMRSLAGTAAPPTRAYSAYVLLCLLLGYTLNFLDRVVVGVLQEPLRKRVFALGLSARAAGRPRVRDPLYRHRRSHCPLGRPWQQGLHRLPRHRTLEHHGPR